MPALDRTVRLLKTASSHSVSISNPPSARMPWTIPCCAQACGKAGKRCRVSEWLCNNISAMTAQVPLPSGTCVCQITAVLRLRNHHLLCLNAYCWHEQERDKQKIPFRRHSFYRFSFICFFYTKLHRITKASVSSALLHLYSLHEVRILTTDCSDWTDLLSVYIWVICGLLLTVNCHLLINFRFLPFSIYIPFGNPEPFLTRRPERSKLCSFEGLTSTDSVGVIAWVLSVE